MHDTICFPNPTIQDGASLIKMYSLARTDASIVSEKRITFGQKIQRKISVWR